MRRIRYGSEHHRQAAWPEPCWDCAALDGQKHMFGCCLEECRKCGGQWPWCGHTGIARALDPVWWLLDLVRGR
jgi:hypothetical protein